MRSVPTVFVKAVLSVPCWCGDGQAVLRVGRAGDQVVVVRDRDVCGRTIFDLRLPLGTEDLESIARWPRRSSGGTAA